ncbi:hypothetical protein JKA74_10710 [Marivirga sp. S37H4]|uniref:TonB-dependent receptor plug domain-containing protein n=1 Tax=Marivirga aurantiaca TaxID=2802615 RepID=A0A935C8L2_9BACT|nr:carboxypeptidase-like regulatory domain-containing protein [Marivirga aurantiaca]MBK6265509.1 hypothetical protein [Marivirga aurantiaca]
MTVFLWLINLNLCAQSNIPLLDRNISLNFSSVQLHEALFTISKEADFNLSFNSSIIPSDSLISFKCEEKKLAEIFPSILPGEIDIKTSGNNVILLKKAKSKNEFRKKEITVRGKVIDSRSREPVKGVTILDVYGSQSALTDSTGSFMLHLTHKQQELVLSISKNGYMDSSVLLNPENQEVAFQLAKIEKRTPEVQLKKVESIPIKTVETYPLGRLMVPQLLVAHSENIKGYTRRRFQLSFTPGTSTNLKIAGTVKNEISINLIGGYNYGVDIFEVGGVFNINRTDVSGVQIAGMANLVGREVNGLQISGVFNGTKGKQSGMQIAGFGNFNLDDFSGTQLSGSYNQAKNLVGTQIAGAVNLADTLSGLQLSSVYNKSKHLEGVQISSGLNVSENMKGVQIGIVNRARQQNGFQLGFININDSSEGVSIGLLNFVKSRKFPRIGFAYK